MENQERDKTEEMDVSKNDIDNTDNQDNKNDSSEKKFSEHKAKKHKKESEIIAQLKDENALLNDKFLRLYSEFDNYRKRTAKERLELTKTASESLVKDLLPVLDDFDRALENIPTGNDDLYKELRNGIELIYGKLKNILTLKGLKKIDISVGSDFNTDYQEALTTIPAPREDLKGKVLDIIEKGYMLNDNVIRYSKVVVGA